MIENYDASIKDSFRAIKENRMRNAKRDVCKKHKKKRY